MPATIFVSTLGPLRLWGLLGPLGCALVSPCPVKEVVSKWVLVSVGRLLTEGEECFCLAVIPSVHAKLASRRLETFQTR